MVNIRRKVFAYWLACLLVLLTSCGDTVEIELEKADDVVAVSTVDILKQQYNYQNPTVVEDFVRTYEERGGSEGVIFFKVYSSSELIHKEGSVEISGALDLYPILYRCNESANNVDVWPFLVTEDSGNDQLLYHFIVDINYIRELDTINGDTHEFCILINKTKPNRDPYIDGSTHYISNTLKLSISSELVNL